MTLSEVRALSRADPRLAVVRLDRTSWRVTDATIDDNDPAQLLGYIERLTGERYEVLWLAAPISWSYVDTFEQALTALTDRKHFPGKIKPQRDPAIPSNPAPLFTPRRRRRNDDTSAAPAGQKKPPIGHTPTSNGTLN